MEQHNLKRVRNWQFSTLMDHSIILIQICPKFPLNRKMSINKAYT